MFLPATRVRVLFYRIPRRGILLVSGALLVVSVAQRGALAGEPDFRIIVDKDNSATSIGRDVVANAFLKTSTRWPDGEIIRPIDQRVDSPVRRAFTEAVLKRSVAAMRSYWQQRIFAGRDVPPPELDSDDAVVRYVSEHRGAVGYVSVTTKTGATKVVTVQ